MEKKNVVAYIRVSTDKQVTEGEGLEIQKERIINFCERNNYKLIKIFSDEGISGSKGFEERPALREMIDYCKNPPIEYVIVDKIDRLAREPMEQLFIESKLLVNNVRVQYAEQDSLNKDDPYTECMRTMMMAFAKLERKMINQRLSDGKRKKAEKGDKPGGRQAFGYEYDADGKKTVINESQALIVKEIFSMRSQGTILKDIVLFLNKNKTSWKHKNAYTGKYAGRIWQIETIRKMLKNPFYIGKIIHGGETFDGNHEAIIDMNVWNSIHPDGLTNN